MVLASGSHQQRKGIQYVMRNLCLAIAICLSAATGVPQTSGPQSTPPAHRPTSSPYAGDLGIFEEPGRDTRLQINRVMDILHIGPGMTVADIGAGGGWFSVRAARKVSPGGRVLAEDINAGYLQSIRERAKRENLTNIQTILGKQEDPKLPANSVDAALMLKVYHEIAWPPPLLIGLRVAMRQGARLGIIDRNGNGQDHGLDEKIVKEEVEKAGFKLVDRFDFTKADGQDYFLVFEKK